MNYLIGEFKKQKGSICPGSDSCSENQRRGRKSKEKELSSSMTVQINLPFIAVGKMALKHMDITLTRSKFEELTSDLGRSDSRTSSSGVI